MSSRAAEIRLKTPTEKRTFNMEFVDDLPTGDTIATLTSILEVTTSDLSLTAKSVSGTKAQVTIENGDADKDDNVLRNAPHTHHLLVADDWDHPYSRSQAFFPLKGILEDKYWPPVGRIDNVAGDRNLVCSCPPMEDYAEAAE